MEHCNEVIRLLEERGSLRVFDTKPVPDKILDQVFQAGVHAASAGNLQPFSIIKITSEEDKKYLTEVCGMQKFVGTAPVNLLFCLDFHRLEQWAKVSKAPFGANHSHKHFWVAFQDVIICAQTICTALDSFGIGSCYIGTTLDCNDSLIERFRLPQGVFPVVLLSLGYPKEGGKTTVSPKLKAGDVVHDGYYHPYSDEEILKMYRAKYKGNLIYMDENKKKRIYEAARAVNGEEYAALVLEELNLAQGINYAQHRFGLHYAADEMLLGKEEMKAALVKQNILFSRTEQDT